jgi:hypothetical protein
MMNLKKHTLITMCMILIFLNTGCLERTEPVSKEKALEKADWIFHNECEEKKLNPNNYQSGIITGEKGSSWDITYINKKDQKDILIGLDQYGYLEDID